MVGDNTLLYRALDRMEANLLAEALESAGIPVVLAGGSAPFLFGEVGAREAFGTDLWVPLGDLVRGRQVIVDLQARRGRHGAGDPWTCASCGTRGEPGFTRCWSCGAERADPRDVSTKRQLPEA